MSMGKVLTAVANFLAVAGAIVAVNHAHWAEIGVVFLLLLPVFAISAIVGLTLSIVSWRRRRARQTGAWLDVVLVVVYAIELVPAIFGLGFMVLVK